MVWERESLPQTESIRVAESVDMQIFLGKKRGDSNSPSEYFSAPAFINNHLTWATYPRRFMGQFYAGLPTIPHSFYSQPVRKLTVTRKGALNAVPV